MTPWPKLSAPIDPLETFHIAVARSAATRNRPPARPTGNVYTLPRREARNQPDPPGVKK